MADMDANMMDVDGDIILDVEPGMEPELPQDEEQQQPTVEMEEGEADNDGDADMPAAYYESLETLRPWPETLNLQGVLDFGPNDPLDYALEHCPERKPKRLRWVNDNSVNIEYYSPTDAADALLVLTHPDAGVAAILPPQTPRKAQSYSKKPNSELVVREANTGDQKQRNAAERSEFYRKNPTARERDQERRRERQKAPPAVLDYGDEGPEENGRSGSFDERMSEDRDSHRGGARGRRPANWDRRDSGRQVDRYRPRSQSPRESKFGRLRGRSASPASDEDGRMGFSENGRTNRGYRRSRSRNDQRRRRSPSREREFRKRGPDLETSRWERDRFEEHDTGRRASNRPPSPMSHHRRSDATDHTNQKGSLLSRMTKDGKPVVQTRSLADRITRVEDDDERDEPYYDRPRVRVDDEASFGRSSRGRGGFRSGFGRSRGRDDEVSSYGRLNQDESYGRLKDDDSAPREDSFQEPISARGGADLVSRITWVRDGGGKRGSSNQDSGFSIRGTAAQSGGYSIRGAAGGD